MAEQTRGEILMAARRLFAERGYAATSINDIAAEANVAVQTIYARLGSKRGMLIGLIDLIDEEAGVEQLVEQVLSATTAPETLRAEVHLTRVFQERCGDIIGALFSAAGAEPELAESVAEGQRRHREGARLTIEKIVQLDGLQGQVQPDHAEALLTLSTTYEAWRELVHSYELGWDDAEAWLTESLARALLKPATQKEEAPLSGRKQDRRHRSK